MTTEPTESPTHLWDEYRDALGPTEDRKAAIYQGLTARAADGDPGPDVASGTTAAVWKATIVLAVVVAVPLVLLAGRGDDAAPSSRPAPAVATAPSEDPEPTPAPVAVVPAPPAQEAEAAPPSPAEPTANDTDPRPRKKARRPQPPPEETAENAEKASTLELEVRLIKQTWAAIKAERFGVALQLVRRQARQFPDGVFRSEVEVAHAVALCGLGRVDEGRSVSQKFLAKNPGSPLAARIRKACPTGGN